jgi:hydrogenase maturation protease
MKQDVTASKILLFGIGNEYREDDGLGLYIARHARVRRLRNLTIIENSGDGMAMMEAWKDAGTVVLVDAVRSGRPPGTIFHFDFLQHPVPADMFRLSSHDISIPECVELSIKLQLLPEKLLFYGVEGAFFGQGKQLSPAVTAAAAVLVDQIVKDFDGESAENQ